MIYHHDDREWRSWTECGRLYLLGMNVPAWLIYQRSEAGLDELNFCLSYCSCGKDEDIVHQTVVPVQLVVLSYIHFYKLNNKLINHLKLNCDVQQKLVSSTPFKTEVCDGEPADNNQS